MSEHEQIQYHTARAMRELDQGLTAQSEAAARSHLKLSSLHLQRARALSSEPIRATPPCIMG